MYPTIKPKRMLTAALCIAMTRCAGAPPVAYKDIASSSYLAPNPQDDSGRLPYRYSTPVSWRDYRHVIIDPVVIYSGPDNQFGDMSEDDKSALASYMQDQFTKKLKTRFTLVDNAAPNTLRVKLTLTGATTTTPVLGTLLHLDLAGNIYNGVQAIRGREGMMMGDVVYAAEIYDAASNRLLSATVAKQYPNPLNIMASMGSLAASKTGIEKGADTLVAQLR
jgi:hypothetical protein